MFVLLGKQPTFQSKNGQYSALSKRHIITTYPAQLSEVYTKVQSLMKFRVKFLETVSSEVVGNKGCS